MPDTNETPFAELKMAGASKSGVREAQIEVLNEIRDLLKVINQAVQAVKAEATPENVAELVLALKSWLSAEC